MSDRTPYAGRWVALIGEQVVGIGYTAEEAYQSARHSRPKERFILHFEEGIVEHPLPFPPLLQQIREILLGEPGPVYLVGGAVRDALLGRENYDLDFVLPKGAVRLAFRVANALMAPAYVLDDQRDTGRVVLAYPNTMLDFASFRAPDLEADLQDRDFTINALAIPATAQSRQAVIDPTGGLQDLQQQTIRAIHPQSLANDPVRSIRAVRLAASLGFKITDDTKSLITSAVPALDSISAERKRDELLKIMLTSRPGDALQQMEQLGLLPALLPEVADLSGLSQSPPHFEDVLAHTRRVLDYLVNLEQQLFSEDTSPDPALVIAQQSLARFSPYLEKYLAEPVDGGLDRHVILRLGALFHDVGKKETQEIDADGRIRFFGHAAVGAKMAGKRLRALSLSKSAITQVKRIIEGHMRPLSLVQAQGSSPSRRAVYRFFQAAQENGLDICLLALADHLATHDGPGEEESWLALLGLVEHLFEYYFEKPEEAVKPPQLLSGRDLIDLLGMKPGPEIGRVLRLVEENQAAGEIKSREEALQFASEQIQ